MGTSNHISQFYQLIANNKAILYKICHSYCGNEAEHEDLLQEMMYHLWKSAQSFKPEYRFTTWMYRVALNVAISYYRKSKNDVKKVSLTDINVDIAAIPPTSDKELQLQQLQQSIAQLNELDRALILLWLDEKSYAEIAEVMGISVSNVATRISRIKEKLKQQLQHLQNS
jgi:RNA polymerase sigma-70 factor (ECF subfamily)